MTLSIGRLHGMQVSDEAYNKAFIQNLESIQGNVCLALLGHTRRSSKEKLSQELNLESLQRRHWYRKLCFFL